MKPSRRKQLERAGFKVGGAQDFLGLSDDEMALIDLKLRLLEMVKATRKSKALTQQQLAQMIGSSQSRIAKMETDASGISLDLICKTLFVMGVSEREIGKRIAAGQAA
ncbi:MAG TPA: helix-turn-helix transcriptional regulator [Tepidisphaeraceae bacterium]|jgi:DNA-binding XRE family transcriptional regulator